MEYYTCSVCGKIFADAKGEKELKDVAAQLAAIIIQNRDYYIAARKETVRQNPETGAGSLFELPSDNNVINRTVKLVEAFLNCL